MKKLVTAIAAIAISLTMIGCSDISGESTLSDVFEELRGEPGINGQNGVDGQDVYTLWLDQGNEGNETVFLEWLKGEVGTSGIDGTDGVNGVCPGECNATIDPVPCPEPIVCPEPETFPKNLVEGDSNMHFIIWFNREDLGQYQMQHLAEAGYIPSLATSQNASITGEIPEGAGVDEPGMKMIDRNGTTIIYSVMPLVDNTLSGSIQHGMGLNFVQEVSVATD